MNSKKNYFIIIFNSILVFVFVLLFITSCFKGSKADLIVHNAIIHSLNSKDEIFEAMAIKDGKILDLGPEREILNKYNGRQINCKKRHLYPGFIDANSTLIKKAKRELNTELLKKHSPKARNFELKESKLKLKQKIQKIQKKLFSYGITSIQEMDLEIDDLEFYKEIENQNILKIKNYIILNSTKKSIDFFLNQGKFKSTLLKVSSLNFNFLDTLNSIKKIDSIAKFCKNNDIQFNLNCNNLIPMDLIFNTVKEHLKNKKESRWRILNSTNNEATNFYFKYNLIPIVKPIQTFVENVNIKKQLDSSKIIISTSEEISETSNPMSNFIYAVYNKPPEFIENKNENCNTCISKKEVLLSMTLWAAMGSFEENIKGTLEKNKFADFIILNQDFMKVPKNKITNTYVLNTFINGKQVYSLN